jgi:hypothetical protein
MTAQTVHLLCPLRASSRSTPRRFTLPLLLAPRRRWDTQLLLVQSLLALALPRVLAPLRLDLAPTSEDLLLSPGASALSTLARVVSPSQLVSSHPD